MIKHIMRALPMVCMIALVIVVVCCMAQAAHSCDRQFVVQQTQVVLPHSTAFFASSQPVFVIREFVATPVVVPQQNIIQQRIVQRIIVR